MPDPILIFANPIAGRGKGRAIAERLRNRLAQETLPSKLVLTRAQDLGDDALPSRVRAAIAIGGDGTVRGVVRRLFQRYGERTPPTLVVPMGTANLLGKHLGIRWTDEDLPDQVAAAIVAKRTRRLDAATANDDLFLLMAGIGLDAKVVHELDRVRSGPIDYTSYALPAALALGFYSYPPLTVKVVGKTICKSLPSFAFVGNVKEYGTGFAVLPDARPDDGLLDVCVLPAANRADAIRHVLRAATGEHVAAEGVIYTKGKDITIESPEQVPVQIDGEAAGHTPLHCKLLPVRLPFIVPPSEI